MVQFTGLTISGGMSISPSPSTPPPGALGTCYCGGYYMGVLCGYYLIVAPNSTGCAACAWKTSDTATSGTLSSTNGYTNTRPPMENATHPAGNWTATRTINGFSDWYLPAISELQVIYNNGGKDGTGVLPAGEGYHDTIYWSSTENGAEPHKGCRVYFSIGTQGSGAKQFAFPFRAIRRVPI